MEPHGSKNRTSRTGLVIKEYRTSQGITQKQLAQKLGVDARTLRMYENGERTLENISELQRIATLLAIDPEELGLAARRDESATPERINEVVERLWSFIPQARFVEARKTLETFSQNVRKQTRSDSLPFLYALASFHHVAGHVQAITRRTSEVEHVIYHFKKMEQIACILEDQTMLNLAMSYQGDMLRRRGEVSQGIFYLEKASESTPLANELARGTNAQLLARAYLCNNDLDGFESAMNRAEDLASSIDATGDNTFIFSLGTVYEEYARSYGRMGKLEKSLSYLDLAETHLPLNNLWSVVLKAARAEALVHGGEVASGMPLAIEVAHLAQMYGHQRLLERLYSLQSYLDEQASLMRQACRSLNNVLYGLIER